MTNALVEMTVHVAADKMAVLVDGSVAGGSVLGAVEFIDHEMESLGIANRPNHRAIEERLRAALAGGETLRGVILFEGIAPVPPTHGAIEWLGEFFTEGFATDEATGTIDYRRRLAQPAVSVNQPLARLIAPVDGVEGNDVLGKRIPSPKGKPARVTLGKNVRFDESTATFHAATDGRIRWNGTTLSVDEVYSISGSVGLETGDINHPGALLIEQDILNGSHVTAAGDIDVHGVIEGASIEAGGNLTVHGGITNSGDHCVKVAGNVHARYILEARIEAGGNIEVEKEIIHSFLVSHGVVNASKGRIVGGETTALDAIQIGQAGSESVVATHLTVTGDTETAREIAARETRIAECEERLAQIHHAIDPLISRQSQLPEHKQQAIHQLMDKAREFESAMGDLRDEIDHLRKQSALHVNPRIQIYDKVFPECILSVAASSFRVEECLFGPIQVVAPRGVVQLCSFTPA